MTEKPVFRFAPSPNGHLHLGHAYSALLNQKMARDAGGKLLLRIEDIDIIRCTPELETQMLKDLEWLGFEWDEKPRRQSEHFDNYEEALDRLNKLDVIYPSTLSRSEIKKIIQAKRQEGIDWPTDPDRTPLYPGTERDLNAAQRDDLIASGKNYALRLDMQKACSQTKSNLFWREGKKHNLEEIEANPQAWGDIILARKDFPVSYHLCCTLDDALQGVTHIVRGKDLYEATSVHVLLSGLLGLSLPCYHHHNLILNEDEEKLSKSKKHKSLKELRASGITAEQIKQDLGFI